MGGFKTVDEILDFAISAEENAMAFYTRLAGKMKEPWMSDLFIGFAEEEKTHKATLLDVKEGKGLKPVEGKIQDLKIADYVADVEARPDMNFQEALILAMKKEKKAFKLYTDLAEIAESEELKQTFTALAQEEAKHKLRIEITYDDQILSDN